MFSDNKNIFYVFFLTEWLLRNILFFNKDRSPLPGVPSLVKTAADCGRSGCVWVANSAELVTVH